MTEPSGLGILLVAAAAVATGYSKYQDYVTPDPDSPEAIHEAYLAGDIDEAEMERRLELVLDEDAKRIREAVEPVPGIGPEMSAAIAAEFETVSDLETADREELTGINGIGPSRADAILQRLQ